MQNHPYIAILRLFRGVKSSDVVLPLKSKWIETLIILLFHMREDEPIFEPEIVGGAVYWKVNLCQCCDNLLNVVCINAESVLEQQLKLL